MWIFTRYGFYSVVQARKIEQGFVTDEPDPDNLMVRARVRQHLVNLQMGAPVLESCSILESSNNDYRYRMVIPKKTWLEIAQGLTEDIDYTNFKSICEQEGLVDGSYCDALHHIWAIHHQLQTEQEHR